MLDKPEYIMTGYLGKGVVGVEKWAPRPDPVQWLRGTTTAGVTVAIFGDPYSDERATVTIDGQPATILRCARMRDGGTTDVITDLGHVHRPQRAFPARGSRLATLDGEVIHELMPGE